MSVLTFLFNLLSQPESGVATPPKKPWPPIGGDRRVSVSGHFQPNGFTPPLYGRVLRSLHGCWLACLSLTIISRRFRLPEVLSQILLVLDVFGVVEGVQSSFRALNILEDV